MQGRKELTPKMLYQVHLQDLIPEHNFYRLLDKAIDFHFLYKATAQYYGEEVFLNLFKKVLSLCVSKGMVRGKRKTVEPVIGTLVNFTNMKRVNTRGIKNANKHVLMASITYNLKKYLKFITRKPKSQAGIVASMKGKVQTSLKTTFYRLKSAFLNPCKIYHLQLELKNKPL